NPTRSNIHSSSCSTHSDLRQRPTSVTDIPRNEVAPVFWPETTPYRRVCSDRMWLRQWRHVQRNERHCSHAPAAQRPSHHSTSQKEKERNSFSFRRTWEGLDNKEFFFDTWEVKDGRDKTGGWCP
ncbi:hypothetical protein J6590_105473, partial [Homalodisca vitripennis]